MDLEDLTQAMHVFVESKGWCAEHSSRPQTPKNLAVSLLLEAGEVLELFQWSDEAADRAELASELADVMLLPLAAGQHQPDRPGGGCHRQAARKRSAQLAGRRFPAKSVNRLDSVSLLFCSAPIIIQRMDCKH